MESNHRFLDVNQVSLPLDHGTMFLKLRELESNQRPPGSEPGVTANSNYPAMIVVLLDDNICDGFTRSRGGRNRTYASWIKARYHYQQQLPRINMERDGRESNPRGCLTGTCSAAELPTQNFSPSR